MHDIKLIRQNPDAFDAALARRGLAGKSKEILALDAEKRAQQTQLQELLSKRNGFAKQIGEAKRKGEDAAGIMAEAKANNDAISALESTLSGHGALEAVLEIIPNLPADDVPEGKDEHDNKELRVVGKKPEFSFTPKQHDEIGEKLGLMDFEGAAKLSGARFVVLKGALARMERALASLFLDTHVAAGYTEMVPPFLVRDTAAYGTGNLPKFEEDLFKTTNDFYLIPTAEIPLTNLVADSIIEEEKLPIRMTAYTPCFRSEAGSAGRDTKGMIRQHQFSKVEMVSITTPEQSKDEHERMTGQAEALLQKLGLSYRVVLLCTGDMGFSAEKTYDIEVWMPGQNAYREISSCSNCGAFQARRMKARYSRRIIRDYTAEPYNNDPALFVINRRNDIRLGTKENLAVHTLNGSGLPIGRTMVAIIENYQQADGSILVPEVLQPYMGGLKVIQ